MLDHLVGREVNILTSGVLIAGRGKHNVALTGVLVDFDEDFLYLSCLGEIQFDTAIARSKICVISVIPTDTLKFIKDEDPGYSQ